MKTMKHRLLLLALAGCAILAGCASDGSDDKGPEAIATVEKPG